MTVCVSGEIWNGEVGRGKVAFLEGDSFLFRVSVLKVGRTDGGKGGTECLVGRRGEGGEGGNPDALVGKILHFVKVIIKFHPLIGAFFWETYFYYNTKILSLKGRPGINFLIFGHDIWREDEDETGRLHLKI